MNYVRVQTIRHYILTHNRRTAKDIAKNDDRRKTMAVFSYANDWRRKLLRIPVRRVYPMDYRLYQWRHNWGG